MMNRDSKIFVILFISAMILSAQPIPAQETSDDISRELHRVAHMCDLVDSVELPLPSGLGSRGEVSILYYDNIGVVVVIDYRSTTVQFRIYKMPGFKYELLKPIAEIALDMIANDNCEGATKISKGFYTL
jgi:hypothetical protein